MIDKTLPFSFSSISNNSNSSLNIEDLNKWRYLKISQQPEWRNHKNYKTILQQLSLLPPLVFAGEVDLLKKRLALVCKGKAFLLQGGDCAETFESATANKISTKIKTILQMAVVLTYGSSMPVIKMGRIAGQFAKPRSSNNETRKHITLPAYRGDIINGYDFDDSSRKHDPKRMLKAYNTSASTLNLIRAFIQGGFSDLRLVHEWNKGFTSNPAHSRYESLAQDIDKAIKFMKACGTDFGALKQVEFFSSHEALLLDYEQALTRLNSRKQVPYISSGHFLWIGERTRNLNHAHVDFLSKVSNPIGVKIGPSVTLKEILLLIKKLNPNNEPGRLTFITRLGASNIRRVLPSLIKKVKNNGYQILWVCDPMHGNTVTSNNGYKTRNFDDIMDEVKGFFEVHHSLGTFPGGVHIEMTGDDVAECLGGADPINQDAFKERYESLCDPRLNHMQSLELAFLISKALSKSKIK